MCNKYIIFKFHPKYIQYIQGVFAEKNMDNISDNKRRLGFKIFCVELIAQLRRTGIG